MPLRKIENGDSSHWNVKPGKYHKLVIDMAAQRGGYSVRAI